jgi:hypothetical protein
MKNYPHNNRLLCLAIILFVFLIAMSDTQAGMLWFVINDNQASPRSGEIFKTEIQFTTWDVAMGAFFVTLNYDRDILKINQITLPNESAFSGNCFADETSFDSGKTDICGFQVENDAGYEVPTTLMAIDWKILGDPNTTANIALEAKAMIDFSWHPIDVINSQIEFEIVPPSPEITTTTTGPSTTTTTVMKLCPARKTLAGDNHSIAILDSLRDQVLSKTTAGTNYINLYYKHAPEITRILSSQSGCEKRARQLIIDMLPAINNLIAGREVTIQDGTVNEGLMVIDNLLTYASPELQKDLLQLKQDIQSGVIFDTIGVEVEN